MRTERPQVNMQSRLIDRRENLLRFGPAADDDVTTYGVRFLANAIYKRNCLFTRVVDVHDHQIGWPVRDDRANFVHVRNQMNQMTALLKPWSQRPTYAGVLMHDQDAPCLAINGA